MTMHYLLFYDVIDDYIERRAPLRAEHLAYARESCLRGELIQGGAYADPTDGALLVFNGTSPAVAEDFARSDPYVVNGLVGRWWVRAWITVIGESAVAPMIVGLGDRDPVLP
jgi:uncharacterized protein YciI